MCGKRLTSGKEHALIPDFQQISVDNHTEEHFLSSSELFFCSFSGKVNGAASFVLRQRRLFQI